MANKTTKKDITLEKEKEGMLIFKANKPMKEDEYNLLSKLVKQEEKASGVKIVLMPFSVDLVEGDINITDEEPTDNQGNTKDNDGKEKTAANNKDKQEKEKEDKPADKK